MAEQQKSSSRRVLLVYPVKEIEKRWQAYWQELGLYRAPRKPDPGKKAYVLEMFPYPSGDLHMGHLKNYVIGDVVARLALKEGQQVLHPMGWDAFGLPAENAAIKRNIHPRDWTYRNIDTFRKTFQELGIGYDWDREIATCEPEYYRWTQWIFLKLYERGLAYRESGYVNWCPTCKTVLANEQVVQGRCERCGTPVVKKELEQWYFRITAYAERLLQDLKKLEGKWPDQVLKQQVNWIGRSEGVEIHFVLEETGDVLPVFTTRADTVFGVTFLTIAPEHKLVQKLLPRMPHRAEVEAYVQQALQMSEQDRTAAERPKTGVFTGLYVRHPFTGERVPLWVGDYVLASYGTGIVMGVPAHDQRDFEFARKFGLPIRVVIQPTEGEAPDPGTLDHAFEDYGVMVNSGEFSGLPSQEGIRRVAERLQALGLGGPTVTYRLRDWLISRQRYWGAPIPVVHCPKCGVVPVPEDQLPVRLPENVENFKPRGRSPLEDIPEFMNTSCPRCGGPARRDPDTMDTFVDSSWYFLRFTDPKNPGAPFDPEVANAWMPVDQYIGGAEHATKHLIYARFITKVLKDAGYLDHDEPFERLFTQGLVHMRFYWCPTCRRSIAGEAIATELEEREVQGEHRLVHRSCGTPVEERVEMMSKSRGNVVPVGPFVAQYGSDVARITILFAAPAERDMEWTDAGVEGAQRFLNRIWRLFEEVQPSRQVADAYRPEDAHGPERQLLRSLHTTIQAVRRDTRGFHFNTALARIMELLNDLYRYPDRQAPVVHAVFRDLLVLLSPFAPHLAEELWHRMGYDRPVVLEPLPEPDPHLLQQEVVEIPVQVNGKLRARIQVPRDADQETVVHQALDHPNVQRHLEGKTLRKVVYIPNRLLNLVVS